MPPPSDPPKLGLNGALRAMAPLGLVPTGGPRWLMPARERVSHFPSPATLSRPAGRPCPTLPAATAIYRPIGFPAKPPPQDLCSCHARLRSCSPLQLLACVPRSRVAPGTVLALQNDPEQPHNDPALDSQSKAELGPSLFGGRGHFVWGAKRRGLRTCTAPLFVTRETGSNPPAHRPGPGLATSFPLRDPCTDGWEGTGRMAVCRRPHKITRSKEPARKVRSVCRQWANGGRTHAPAGRRGERTCGSPQERGSPGCRRMTCTSP